MLDGLGDQAPVFCVPRMSTGMSTQQPPTGRHRKHLHRQRADEPPVIPPICPGESEASTGVRFDVTGDAQLIEELKSLLSCPVCLEPFDQPKVLSCQHTFCLACLRQISRRKVTSRLTDTRTVACPICRAVSKLPPAGVTQFPDDFRTKQLRDILACIERRRASSLQALHQAFTASAASVIGASKMSCDICKQGGGLIDRVAEKFCFDCAKYFCARCARRHNRIPVMTDHFIIRTGVDSETVVKPADEEIQQLTSAIQPLTASSWSCEKHRGETYGYECAQCDEPLCVFCLLQDNEHDGHVIMTPSEAAGRKAQLLRTYLDELRSLDDACADRLAMIDQLVDNQNEAVRQSAAAVSRCALPEAERETRLETVSASQQEKIADLELINASVQMTQDSAREDFATIERILEKRAVLAKNRFLVYGAIAGHVKRHMDERVLMDIPPELCEYKVIGRDGEVRTEDGLQSDSSVVQSDRRLAGRGAVDYWIRCAAAVALQVPVNKVM